MVQVTRTTKLHNSLQTQSLPNNDNIWYLTCVTRAMLPPLLLIALGPAPLATDAPTVAETEAATLVATVTAVHG